MFGHLAFTVLTNFHLLFSLDLYKLGPATNFIMPFRNLLICSSLLVSFRKNSCNYDITPAGMNLLVIGILSKDAYQLIFQFFHLDILKEGHFLTYICLDFKIFHPYWHVAVTCNYFNFSYACFHSQYSFFYSIYKSGRRSVLLVIKHYQLLFIHRSFFITGKV